MRPKKPSIASMMGLMVLLLQLRCASTPVYTAGANPASVPQWPREQAARELSAAVSEIKPHAKVELRYKGDGLLVLVEPHNPEQSKQYLFFPYADSRSYTVVDEGMGVYSVHAQGPPTMEFRLNSVYGEGPVRKFVQALYLTHGYVKGDRERILASVAPFDQYHAAGYRKGVRHPFPEAAHKWRVLAEQNFRERKYLEAAFRYWDALALAPDWPEGRFNLALLLAAERYYVEAAALMKMYLMLVPKAPNARLAQDKIYAWEAKK